MKEIFSLVTPYNDHHQQMSHLKLIPCFVNSHVTVLMCSANHRHVHGSHLHQMWYITHYTPISFIFRLGGGGVVHEAAKLSVHMLESLGTFPAVFVMTNTCEAILSRAVMRS